MTTFIALLRAVNVGGTGKLPMGELKSMCEAAGFTGVQTYIASGNVVFDSQESARQVKTLLEAALHEYAGKPVAVFVRSAGEMQAVLDANPYPDAAPNRVVAIFLDAAPAADAATTVSGLRDEELALGKREIYVHYGQGMGTSRLKIPAADKGTARNMNTVARLAQIGAARGQ